MGVGQGLKKLAVVKTAFGSHTGEWRGEWPSGPASSISFTEGKHGCVRSETGWATFQMNDQTAHSVPGCSMHSRPNLAEKARNNSLLRIK